ncbi:rod shape-determining protein MreD [Streptococcus sp. ZJ93]|uniref:rod shape-determining protein MreD n=1 Tax=Streptococcus handemini TaxID=3161188 RepID=UPI0032EFCEA6
MKKYIFYFLPFLLLFAFLLDAQLSTLLTNLAPKAVSISSHLLLIVGIFASFYVMVTPMMVLFVVLGFVYDIYYFNIIGLSTALLPLTVYLVYYVYQSLAFKRVTNYILLLVMVFTFEFGTFLLARLFQLTNLSMFIFVFYNLVPSLVFNTFLLVMIHPLMEKLFGITNKT